MSIPKTALRKSPSGPLTPPEPGDHKVLVSAADTIAKFLADKIIAGAGIQIDVTTAGDGSEQLTVKATGGGTVSGPPDAVAYYDSLGAITGDAAFTALPIDAFGRPQLWDRRIVGAPGTGSVWRNGEWQVDGDPGNVQGEGYVTYGPAENGLQDGANGAFGHVKYNRFGIRYIIGGVDIGYAWRVDPTHMFFTDDTAS